MSKNQSKISLNPLNIKQKRSFMNSRRKQQEKAINEENYKMMVRIIKQSPSVSLKQQAKDFKKHLAAKKVLQ